MARKILLILIINTILSLCQDIYLKSPQNQNIKTNDAAEQSDNQNKNSSKGASKSTQYYNDIYSNNQRIIDETECPRVSKFLDLIEENQTSLIQVSALDHIENSNILIVGTQSGDIELWDFQTRDILSRFSVNNQGASIKQIMYLSDLDKILVLYDVPLSLSNDNQSQYSIVLWDPQTQRQVIQFPKADNFSVNLKQLGNKVIDLQVKSFTETSSNKQSSLNVKIVTISDTSIFIFSINQNLNINCQQTVLNKNYIQDLPLKVFITDNNMYTIFTQNGLIQYNQNLNSYTALLQVQQSHYIECLYFPNQLKYILLKEGDLSMYLFDQDSQKDQLKKITELNSLKSYFQAQNKTLTKDSAIKIVKIQNNQPEFFLLLDNKTLMYINYEDDKILEVFNVENSKVIAPLKNSPSFFIALADGSISFYRQTVYLGEINLQQQNPYTIPNQLRRSISINYQNQSQKNKNHTNYYNYISEMQNNNFTVYHLSFQTISQIINYPIPFSDDYQIADFLVNFKSNIAYFYKPQQQMLFICRINDLEKCISKQLSMNNIIKSESFELKMRKFIHYNQKGGVLIVNDMNSIYIYSINEGIDVKLEDHLQLVVYQKFVSKSQTPAIINTIKQRYQDQNDSILLFFGNESKFFIYEYKISVKSLILVQEFTISSSDSKIVAIEVLQNEQLVVMQFINNKFRFFNLMTKNFEKNEIKFEQQSNSFANYDFQLQLDLIRIEGSPHIISQLNNKRIITFNYKTEQIHFMSDPLNSYVYQFKIDYLQQIFYVSQYSSTENIQYYDLILQRPYLQFRQERGKIEKAQLFALNGQFLILQHYDYSFWVVDLEKQNFKPEKLLQYEQEQPNQKVAFFARQGQFTLINNLGKVYKYPFYNSQITGPPEIIESPCPNCQFDDQISIKNTTIPYLFLLYDSLQIVLYNSLHNSIIWYKKFDSVIVDIKSSIENCQILIGFQNKQIHQWNCQDINNIFLQNQAISQEDIVSIQYSVEDSNRIYVISKNKITFYNMKKMQQKEQDQAHNLFNHPQNDQNANIVFELNDCQILKSQYLIQLGIQILLTSKNQMIIYGFGQQQVIKLQSLTNDPYSIVFIGNTEDKTKIIISTTQKVWFINIGPLFQNLDYKSTKILDFYKEANQIVNNQNSTNTKLKAVSNSLKFNNACLLNIYFQASSETRSMSVFGQGSKSDPYSHFSALQSLIIQVGLSNLIFSYKQNELNLRFFSHDQNLYHKISKRVNLQNSAFTQINFIGEKNTEDGKTVLEIEEGYELNQYMSVTFKNIIFKSIDFSSSTGYNNLISSQTNYLSDLSILQFSVLNIENLIFDNVNFGLYSQNQNVPKYIQVFNCTKLLLNNSEFYGTTFYIDNVSKFQAQKTLIFGMKSDMISNEKQQVNLLKKKGIIFLRQALRNKIALNNKFTLQQINLENCQLNSIKIFAFECFEDQAPNLKAPSLYLNATYMQHSSLIGLDNCRFLQELVINIQTVSLLDLSYKDSQILTDGYISISRIENIQIKNTNKSISNFGSSASFLVQYSKGDTQIGQLILKNLYLSDILLFQVSNNFSIVNTTIIDCKLSYSQIILVQNTLSFANIVVSRVNITNSTIEDNSKFIQIQQTLAINLEVNSLSLLNVTTQQSSLIQVNQDQSQIDVIIKDLLINSCSFSYSKILEKGNQVYVNINKLIIQNNTKFINSLVLKSSANIENQRVNLLNIPMFNTIEQLEITQSTFNESKVMEIKEQAYFYIQNLNLTNNIFFAQSINNNIQQSSPSTQKIPLSIFNNTNEKLPNKNSSDLPFFNNSNFPSATEQDKIRYLIEVTNIKIFNTSIVSNDFQGYIIFGQPQSQQIQSEIEQIYQNLNFSCNKFVPNSNFILLEINFNSLNRNSSVEVSNFTLTNNIIDTLHPNIPLNQLEDGRSFFFFGSDKLGRVLLQNGIIKNNDNVGFVNVKYSLNVVTISNVNATGNLNKSSLQQSFLQVLHPRRFIMTQCLFERYNIVGSTFLSIQLNRQYFQLQNITSVDQKEQNQDIQFKEDKIKIPKNNNNNKSQTKSLNGNHTLENLDQNSVTLKSVVNNFANNNHQISEKRLLQGLNKKDIDQQEEEEQNDQMRIKNSQFNEDQVNYQNRSYDYDEDTFGFIMDSKSELFSEVNINSNTDDSKEELYFVVFFDNKFKHLIAQNISQSISSSVINLQSNLLVNIFLENCLFLQNVVTSGEDYYRQRRLSQVEIQAVNSNIFLSNNQFIYGKFQLPITQFIDTVYFYLSAKYIQFQSYVQSFNHFKGQCDEKTIYNYMASGVLEGKNIKILNSTFNGTCTMIQPTLYIKLYDQSLLEISNSQFLDLYGIQEGSGLVINGVMNQVQINITNITINRMSCPSAQSEGFFFFSNLKKGSVVNIKGVNAKQLYTQNGSLVKSLNDNIFISLKDINIDNSFDAELFREFVYLQNQVDYLQSKKSVQDYFNRLENGKFYPNQGQDDDSIINSDDDEIGINNFFQSSEKIEYNDKQFNKKRLLQSEQQDLLAENSNLMGDQDSLIDFLDVMNYMILNQQTNQIQVKLQQIDSGQLIQILNADVLKIINLKVRNYGIAFSSQNDLIYIYNVKNTLLNKLDIQNNVFFSSGAMRVSYSSVIAKNSIFSNNKYYGQSLILFNQLLLSQNHIINFEINQNICINKISCFSPLLGQQSILHVQNTLISYNKGNNTVGGIFYSLPSKIFDISSIQDIQQHNKTQKNQNTIILKNLTIQNNNASSIGAMAVELGEDLSCKVQNSTFKRNYGVQIGGLSLQLHDPNSIQFENSTITENNSKFTGGVKIQKSSTLQLRNNFSQFIYNNTPNQFTSGPRSFQIIPVEDGLLENINEQNQQNKNLKLAPVKLLETNQTKSYKFIQKQEKLYEVQTFDSGDNLPQFYLKLFDENDQTIIGDQIPNVKVYLSPQSQLRQGSFLKGSDSYFYSYIGQSYNPDIGILFDQLQLYGYPGTNVTIIFKLLDIQYENASSLVPFSSSSQFYNFTINVNLRKCVIGEYIKTSLITTECEMCAKQYYSLLDPHTNQNVKCLRCPDNCNCPGGDQLILEQGYWRDSNSSDVIIECKFSSDNCLGGLMVGDESCTNNRIGPLCEICDIKQGYTDLSASQCLNCKIIWLASLIMALILLFFIFYIFISIDSTVSRIRKFRILFEYSSANHIGQTSMLVKQFVSYLQVLSIISYFRFNFGKESISSIIYNIGNPLIGFNNIVSCFIYQYSKKFDIPHIYISFTVSLLIPISLSLVVLIAQMIINYRNYYYRKYYLITMILVNYFYFTPLLLSRAMELMICRQIGNEKYITASTIYNCNLDSFRKMNIFYFLPLIFILLIAIPVLIIYRIKMRFQQSLPLKYFQYILGDFRKKYFYWEFVRFFTKIALVSLPVLLQEDIRTMGQVLNLILIIYYASVLYFHPYWTEICQKMELITGAAIFVTFHFCLLSYDKDDFSIWWWVTIIVISLTNIPLIFWYIISFFQAYKPSISKFFNYSPRRKMSESDDPQARARLLWQLALFTVKKHIKKEKLQALEAMKNKKRAKPLDNNFMDNSSFITGYSDAEQVQNEQKKSKLLWWRRSGRSSNQGQFNENKLNQSNLNQPLLQQNRYTIMENKLSQNSDDYNPYHDFNFSFLPQEDNNFSNQKTNQFKE
ncbi:transmembrane protein, putative (macronuclear) [Tetrahymena thermophila SB210]|uniref:Transmembrane protein, putative n=1 Tax=Tetrahymena thermophila (strain SB210) TaxID=312017 RepID=I7M4C4_TETTS|nr:transmembrane protein, putative [Tetrahymena thermophila SB210]EAS06214.2 transmembrane protein, putative [Tetrahymena thermophila SB210]|eukprot:XP_001026459.2 transmembrane protein, putative [Tetrahymena thermophila SB210]